MASNNGPAHNTWAQQHLRKTQGSPQIEEQLTIGQESANTPPVTSPAARSSLSPITEDIGKEGEFSNKDYSHEEKTIHEFMEGLYISHQDPEQQYATALASPSMNQSTGSVEIRLMPPLNVHKDKGKGKKLFMPPIGEENTPFRWEQNPPSRMPSIKEEWNLLDNKIGRAHV